MAAGGESGVDVVVVGSSNTDLFAYMKRMPQKGETIHGTSSGMGCGGKGANQAVMAARLGGRVCMVTKLGEDTFAATFRKAYEKDGIIDRHVLSTSEAATGVAQIWVEEDGSNSIVIIPGANNLLTPQEVRQAEATIAASKVVVCQLEIRPETTLEALRVAREHGVLTILNPAPAIPNMPEEMCRLSSIICPNETELSMLTGLPVDTMDQVRQAATILLDKGSETVLVTLGDKGCFLKTRIEEAHITCPTVKAIDTSGAGDAFVGSLAVYLAKGVPLQDSLTRACRVASMTVLKSGTQDSYPHWEDMPEDLRVVT